MSKVVNDNYPPQGGSLSDRELKERFLREQQSPLQSLPTSSPSVATEIIELPSRGLFYPEGHPLADGKIEMRYMTARDEDILSSQTLIKQGVVIDKLLQALIITPVDYDSILTIDKGAIFIAARVLAYGKDYEVEVACPSCGVKSKQMVDLQSFTDRVVDWAGFVKGQTTHKFTLPIGKQELTLKFLTHGDEKRIEEDLKGSRKLGRITGVDPELTTRLRHIIVEVDGKDSASDISKCVNNMLSRDSLALRTHLKKITPDLDTQFLFNCNSCSNEQLINLPIGISFFWPGAGV